MVGELLWIGVYIGLIPVYLFTCAISFTYVVRRFVVVDGVLQVETQLMTCKRF